MCTVENYQIAHQTELGIIGKYRWLGIHIKCHIDCNKESIGIKSAGKTYQVQKNNAKGLNQWHYFESFQTDLF